MYAESVNSCYQEAQQKTPRDSSQGVLVVTPQGLEPQPTEPESVVLPITPWGSVVLDFFCENGVLSVLFGGVKDELYVPSGSDLFQGSKVRQIFGHSGNSVQTATTRRRL